jgi:hypothetical protein
MDQANASDDGSGGYILFAWSPDGWQLSEEHGALPPVGAELERGGHQLVVSKHGPSPLPRDSRPCAFTVGRY